MLAKNFLPHVELGITQLEHAALVEVLRMMEQGDIRNSDSRYSGQEGSFFDMMAFYREDECGTSCCFAGWANLITAGEAFTNIIIFGGRIAPIPDGLRKLFFFVSQDVTVDQGAEALRNYLTTGDPNWDQVGARAL